MSSKFIDENKQILVKKNIVIAGGGTGGHIYPALAIARALQKQCTSLDIHFVGAYGGLEETIVPREGFPLHLLPIGKLHSNVGIWQQLKTVFLLPYVLFQAVKLFIKLKPCIVLGVGGYASAPFLFTASLFKKCPTAIWEPNAHPGMSNRLLAPMVDRCFVVFKEASHMLKNSKITQVGLPVRQHIEDISSMTINKTTKQQKELFKILVFGGSQGARGINNVISQAVVEDAEKSWIESVELVHQTGRLDYENIKNLYAQKAMPQVQVFEFLHDMDIRYMWADLIICRSGASTVAELAAAKKAAILIPFPNASDNHQEKNARILEQNGAAILVIQKDFSVETFKNMIRHLKQNRDELSILEHNIDKFHIPKAAEKIASELLEMKFHNKNKKI